MENTKYIIPLLPDEEKIAQLLTRDAWGFFGSMIASRELFHVKDIPMLPRRGTLAITPDEELIQYYLDFSGAYSEELSLLGWDAQRTCAAADGFASKLEDLSGQVRGRSRLLARQQIGAA
jgi:hypothetical protein